MPKPFHQRTREPFPSDDQAATTSQPGDIMERDVAYVYRVALTKARLGENTRRWEPIPIAFRVSFQEHALNSQHTDPNNAGSRFVRIYTRDRDHVFWKDKVICRGVEYLVDKVIDHFDNYDGSYHHTEVRMSFLEDNNKDAIRKG